MKRKRRNSLKSSCSQQQIVASSSIQTRSKTKRRLAEIVFYLPNDCWESVFKSVISNKYDDYNNRRNLKSLSVVSKQFLSITNHLLFSLKIIDQTRPFLPRLYRRFTNLTSLKLTCPVTDLDILLRQISHFPLNLTSVVLSLKHTFPANGLHANWLRGFSRKITTLTSLVFSTTSCLHSSVLFLIAYCFPNLQVLDLGGVHQIFDKGIVHVLRTCCNITHLNLTGCFGVSQLLGGMNFEVPKLKYLNLANTLVDDETLHMVSKNCLGLLQLGLSYCHYVTEKGVRHVVENCKQLTYLWCSRGVNIHVLLSMVPSRPSLREINGRRLSYYLVADKGNSC